MAVGAGPRIGIDVTSGVNQGAGIGRSTREAVTALVSHPARLSLSLFYAREPTSVAEAGEAWLAELVSLRSGIRVRRLPLPPRLLTRLWLRLRLPVPAEVVTGRVDVLWAPDFVAPPVARARTVVTVHDLSFLTVPQYAEPGLRGYLASTVPASLRRAAHIVAVSHATKRDLVHHLGIAPEQISVAYNGVDSRFRPLPPETVAAMRQRHHLPARFILTVGTLEPRKNHLSLIRAFAQLAPLVPDLELVIAGRRGWMEQPIFEEVKHQQLGSRVRFLGAFPDVDLPALYNAAAVFAYPSWYEGFGLPPLEAMACGVPVVTSAGGALQEVCGGAALTVAPGDICELANALRCVIEDEAERQLLSGRGRDQAARFTWSATADALVEVFQQVQ